MAETEDLKQAKQEVEEAAKNINERMDSLQKELDETKKQAKDGGLDNDTKDRLKEIEQQYNDENEGLKAQKEKLTSIEEKLEKQQEHLDHLDVGKQKQERSFLDALKSNYDDNKEKIDDIVSGKKSEVGFAIKQPRIKADMDLSNLEGETIDRDRIPGIFFDPDRSVHIRNFINRTPVNTDVIRYVQEKSFTDNTGTRSEGSAAGQSDVTLESKSETIQSIATHMTVTREALADYDQFENYLTTRGFAKLLSSEDTQILTGNGSDPNLNGIKSNAAAYNDLLADSNATKFDVLENAGTNVRVNGNGGYEPNLALIHPQDMLKLKTAKNSDGTYHLPNIFTGQPLNIGGIRVVPNTAVSSDNFYVGDFNLGATFGIREELAVRMTSSHDDHFSKGFVDLMLEERVVLVIYRPNAFIHETFANAQGAATG